VLRSIRCTDFKCFREFTLGDLESRGLVVVQGESGSGKSAVAEALHFGLTGQLPGGRTPEGADVVRWGSDDTEVTIELENSRGDALLVRRRCGEDGALEVALEMGREQEISDDPATVARVLAEATGLSPARMEFIEWVANNGRGDNVLGPMAMLARLLGLQDRRNRAEKLEREQQDLQEQLGQLDATILTLRETLAKVAPGVIAMLDREATDVGSVPAHQLLFQVEENSSPEFAEAVEGLSANLHWAHERALTMRLDSRVARLEECVDQLRTQLDRMGLEVQQAEEAVQDWRLFSEGLGELQSLFRSTASDLADNSFGASGVGFRLRIIVERAKQLEEDGEADPTSETNRLEREKRHLIERIAEEEALRDQLERRIKRMRYWMVIAGCLGVLYWLQTRNPAGLFIIPLVFMVIPVVQVNSERLKATTKRCAELQIGLHATEEQQQEAIRLAGVCDRVIVRDRENLLRSLEQFPAGPVRELADRLQERHPEFWADSEAYLLGYDDGLEGRVTLKRVMHGRLLTWLLETEQALDELRSSFQRLARPEFLESVCRPDASGLPREGLAGRIHRDLDILEQLRLRYPDDEPPADVEDLQETLEGQLRRIAPEDPSAWPETEGLTMILEGKLPEAIVPGDDALPWVEAQIRSAFQLVQAVAPFESVPSSLAPEGLATEVQELDPEEVARYQDRVRIFAEIRRAREEIERQLGASLQRSEGLMGGLKVTATRLTEQFSAKASPIAASLTRGSLAELRIGEGDVLEVKPRAAGRFLPIGALSGGDRDAAQLAARLATASLAREGVEGPEGCDGISDGGFLLLDDPMQGASPEDLARLMEVLEAGVNGVELVLLFTRQRCKVPKDTLALELEQEADTFAFPSDATRREALAKALF
jgi:hypothetical protein